jgi:hypothetical protein
MDEVKSNHDTSTEHVTVPVTREANASIAHNDAVITVPRRLLRAVGGVGVAMTIPVFSWLLLGMLDSVPSMVDVFGVAGLRMPASIAVCGLLMAAIGFHKD